MIFCGDFFQLPPITKYGDVARRFAFAGNAWKSADPDFCYLTSQHRQEKSPFLKILTELRVGQLSEEGLTLLYERIDAPLP